ncbi:glycoside hydrolase family 140 protein [Bacteroidota bacterium]
MKNLRRYFISLVIVTGGLIITMGPKVLSQANAVLPELKVHSGNHYLVSSDGTPFFWMGDTGWTLFQYTPAQMKQYFKDRASKGFSIIQIMVIRHERENYEGQKPFTGKEPVALNESYWQYIDEIIDEAEANGLYISLFPMWGMDADTMFPDSYDGNYQYGKLLGQRYKNRDHVIWSACGEYEKVHFYRDEQEKMVEDYSSPTEEEISFVRQIALGLEAGHGGKNLMTIHPVFTSSKHFHNDPWLDFNQQQTWGNVIPNIDRIFSDYNITPAKPVFNGEPGYENSTRKDNGYIDDFHIRAEAYTSIFSGGFGFTYGAQNIWNFGEDNTRDLSEFLHYEGAYDMKHVRNLMESRPVLIREPDQSVITSAFGSKGSRYTPGDYRAATRASDGSYVFVYSTQGKEFTIDMRKISGPQVNAWWYNPRDGISYDNSGEQVTTPFGTYPAKGTMTFNPPGEAGVGRDWILVLDNASKEFGIPGGK